MNYTVWIQEEFGDTWMPHECGDVGAVKRKVLEAAKSGLTVRVTVEVPFELQLKVGEPGTEVKMTAKEKYRAGIEKTAEEAEVEADKDPAK